MKKKYKTAIAKHKAEIRFLDGTIVSLRRELREYRDIGIMVCTCGAGSKAKQTDFPSTVAPKVDYYSARVLSTFCVDGR